VSDGNIEAPYYLLNHNDFAHLETEMSIIPPEFRENYRSLESTVSAAFIAAYGQYLSDAQRQYIANIQTIFTDHETARVFSDQWDNGIVSIDVKDASIDGNIYMAYSTGSSPEVTIDETRTPEGATVRQYWAGRITVYPLEDQEIYPIDARWLMTRRVFDETTDTMDTKKAFESIPLFVYTNSVGGVIVHEKVHGVQDYRLPLPILEAAAHFYQRELFIANGWHCEIGNNMNILADYYGQCVKELGEDVHRLLFGNIDDPVKRSVLLQQLKDRFSAEKIEALSKYTQHDIRNSQNRWVQWKTETEAQVAAEIAALQGDGIQSHEE
jgi:hypothetical protein